MDIKTVIRQHGITMTEIAERMNTSKGYISQLASGKPEPTLRKLQDLAQAIGCQRWEFFADEIRQAGFAVTPSGSEEVKVNSENSALPLATERTQEFATADNDSATATEQGAAIVPAGSASGIAAEAELPFGEQAQPVSVLRFHYDCPQCHHPVRITIEQG